jgi:hypothetical protein
LEYTIAVPIDIGDQPLTTVADGYRQGIQAVNVEAGGVSTAGSIANIQLLSGKLLVTTWLAAPQIAIIRHGDANIAFDVPHSLANVLPAIPLVSPQVTGALDLLLRNCPNI